MIAFLGFVGCFDDTRAICRGARQHGIPVGKALLMSSIQGFKVYPALLVYWLIYTIPAFFFRCCLPISVKSRVRFARRYGVKAGQRITDKSAMRMKALRKTTVADERKVYVYPGNGQPATLADFLSIYDMLMLVCQHLHYVDIGNLGLVSRHVRETILPADTRIQREIHIKMYTCERGSIKQCWLCMNQICEVSVPASSLTINPTVFVDRN